MEDFECSASATDQATDTNFLGAPETQLLLVEARKAFDKLVEVMEHAE